MAGERFLAGDISSLMESVARSLLGEPNTPLKHNELRYGTHGSLSIDLEKGTWFDNETKQGGGVLDLVTRETGMEGPDRVAWMDNHGFDFDREHKRSTNGHAESKLGNIDATFDYTDEVGKLLAQVVKYDPKDFRQRRPDKEKPNGWNWSVRGVRNVPYRLPELLEALASERTIWIVEGEKDADALWKRSIPATTNIGGAGKWRNELTQFFNDADVIIVGDNDPQSKHPKTKELMFHPDGRPVLPGQDHARQVAAALEPVAFNVRQFDMAQLWPECPPKGDISDYFKAGKTVEALQDFAERLDAWSPDQKPVEAPAVAVEPLPFFDISEFDGVEVRKRRWCVKDRIPMRNVSLLSGDGAIGKTLIALQLAVCVPMSRDWLGGYIDEPGNVFYFTAEEERDEFHGRLKTITEFYGFSYGDLKGKVSLYCAPGEDCVLAAPNRQGLLQPTAMYQRLMVAILAAKPKLVILESVADLFSGNEVDRSQTRQFIRLIRAIAIAADCAVLLLSHPSAAGLASGSGTSGSTGWNNSVRSRMYFSRDDVDDEATDGRVLKVMKANYTKMGEFVRVFYDKGIFKLEPKLDSLDKTVRHKRIDDLFLRLLARFSNQKRNVTNKTGTTYAPALFSKEAEAIEKKITNTMFEESMIRLFAEVPPRIEVIEEGPDSRKRSRLVYTTPNDLFQSRGGEIND